MFADSLLETSWAQRSRRSWTTLTSFGLEAVVIAFLLILPILRTVGIPTARTISTPISAGRPAPVPLTRAHSGRTAVAPTTTARFVAPGRIPDRIAPSEGEAEPETSSECINCVPGMDDIGTSNAPPNAIFGGARSVPMPAAPAATVTRAFRSSTLLEGSLIRRVQPVYPPLARSARVQGPVVLFAVISKAGTIQNLRLVSGHPMLVPAAIEAVSQWRYRPYILNSEPVEVETQITVNFILGN